MIKCYTKIFIYSLGYIYTYLFINIPLSSELLKESDPQIMRSIQEIQDQEPKTMKIKVYYQYKVGNYIAFYDFKGDSLFLEYRIDRWDYSKNHLLRDMRQGLLYEIEFEFQRMVSELPGGVSLEEAASMRSFISGEKKKKVSSSEEKRSSKFPVGRFIRSRIAYLDRLIY